MFSKHSESKSYKSSKSSTNINRSPRVFPSNTSLLPIPHYLAETTTSVVSSSFPHLPLASHTLTRPLTPAGCLSLSANMSGTSRPSRMIVRDPSDPRSSYVAVTVAPRPSYAAPNIVHVRHPSERDYSPPITSHAAPNIPARHPREYGHSPSTTSHATANIVQHRHPSEYRQSAPTTYHPAANIVQVRHPSEYQHSPTATSHDRPTIVEAGYPDDSLEALARSPIMPAPPSWKPDT